MDRPSETLQQPLFDPAVELALLEVRLKPPVDVRFAQRLEFRGCGRAQLCGGAACKQDAESGNKDSGADFDHGPKLVPTI